MNRLTKKQALQLLPSVIDGEATPEEQLAFMTYLEHDRQVKTEFYEALQVKHLISERLQKVKAPEHLKKKIFVLLSETDFENENSFKDIPLARGVSQVSAEMDRAKKQRGFWKPAFRYLVSAAVILFITITLIEFLDRFEVAQAEPASVVENYTARHFIDNQGQLIEPHFATTSTSEAESYLSDHFDMKMAIPAISGAEFAGLVFADFFNGFETPLLEYTQHEINETIFIFVFEVDKIVKHRQLKRDKHAVESCITKTDFYVAEIEDYHVVSWRWDGNWYSAVSNHNGYDLAALIEPLGYSP